jgi:hypothetical protein
VLAVRNLPWKKAARCGYGLEYLGLPSVVAFDVGDCGVLGGVPGEEAIIVGVTAV